MTLFGLKKKAFLRSLPKQEQQVSVARHRKQPSSPCLDALMSKMCLKWLFMCVSPAEVWETGIAALQPHTERPVSRARQPAGQSDGTVKHTNSQIEWTILTAQHTARRCCWGFLLSSAFILIKADLFFSVQSNKANLTFIKWGCKLLARTRCSATEIGL